MSAIERCRTAVLGGHVAACQDCGHSHIAYNSCRNRHCPKCQGAAAKDWLAARQAELLPVPYYHVVFTLPAPIADIAYHNKAVVYAILFKAAAETLITIAADPSCRPGFFLPVRVLSRLFRRLILEKLIAAHEAGRLQFFDDHAELVDHDAFATYLAPLRKSEWVVYAKPPFGGPAAVFSYLSRYTHRVAISNSRLIALDDRGVTFKWKDYRAKGPKPWTTMTLAPSEFIRRFLIHVLPSGFHRIRHYGLFANGGRAENLARARELLDLPAPQDQTEPTTEADQLPSLAQPCFEPGHAPRAPPPRSGDSP
jgi:hypothetical protein